MCSVTMLTLATGMANAVWTMAAVPVQLEVGIRQPIAGFVPRMLIPSILPSYDQTWNWLLTTVR